MENDRKYQSVILTFSNGQMAVFTGKAVCYPDELKTITNIEFTEPRDLPEDCSFAEIENKPKDSAQ